MNLPTTWTPPPAVAWPAHSAVVATACCEHIRGCGLGLVATGDAAFMLGTKGIRLDVAREAIRIAESPASIQSRSGMVAPSGLVPGGDMPYARHRGPEARMEGGQLQVHLPDVGRAAQGDA
jgi:hypothetical protein